MLFLLRPRQTYMPYALPRPPEQQRVQNEQIQHAYSATRRVEPDAPASPGLPVDQLEKLAELHRSGVLTDDEFSAAKAKVLGSDGGTQ